MKSLFLKCPIITVISPSNIALLTSRFSLFYKIVLFFPLFYCLSLSKRYCGTEKRGTYPPYASKRISVRANLLYHIVSFYCPSISLKTLDLFFIVGVRRSKGNVLGVWANYSLQSFF